MVTEKLKPNKTLEERKVEALEKIADKLDTIEVRDGLILIENLGN